MSRTDLFINLGGWTEFELDRTIRKASAIANTGLRINFLSGMFLGLVYRESTLSGGNGSEEILTVDLSGVDCFTFIDYIEAMRRSGSFEGFLENLRRVRYRNGSVAYQKRRHFFTDWAEDEPVYVENLTEVIGGEKVKSIVKVMNLRDDGTPLLPGIASLRRAISYIPAENIDKPFFSKLQIGDYAGIYSPLPGLDVSHVGIIIRNNEDSVILRHASSNKRYRKVIDQDLGKYLTGKPGLIILRPRAVSGQ